MKAEKITKEEYLEAVSDGIYRALTDMMKYEFKDFGGALLDSVRKGVIDSFPGFCKKDIMNSIEKAAYNSLTKE